MAEYTFKNIIIDPTEEGIENLIGKEVYFADQPYICLENANEDYNIGILEKILKDSMYPFQVKTLEGEMRVFSCIIIKDKESKPEYIPFSNASEFIDAYRNATGCLNEEDYFLSSHGIWLKDKDIDDVFYIVTEIWKDGVVLGSDQSTTKWDDILCGYTFLDSSPCGKPMEE